jgi:sterol desaturase/sphingolipid hydroxylase (fatty acid hydroxylase superfamily)
MLVVYVLALVCITELVQRIWPVPVSLENRLEHIANGILLAFLLHLYVESHPREATFAACVGFVLTTPLLADAYFWCAHRLMHTHWLYTTIHSRHHRNRTPGAYHTLVAHPVETVVVNGGTLLFPLWLWGMGSVFATLWAFVALTNSVWSHAEPGYHTRHHEVMHSNFGLKLCMDRWMGTRAS